MTITYHSLYIDASENLQSLGIALTMPKPSRANPEVREFILAHVAAHPSGIGPLTAKEFGLSRAAVSGYLNRLVAEGLITASGNTKARKYERRPLHEEIFNIRLTRDLPEDAIWRNRILPGMQAVRPNIVGICQFGFTEMLNNCIDHSASEHAFVHFSRFYDEIILMVMDRGVGIFNKISKDFGLTDPRHALLELSKGKLTSDVKRHSGEGIFFTSRMFNLFNVCSGDLFYSREMTEDDEWLIETDHLKETTPGTQIQMKIYTDAHWTKSEVFDKYQEPGHIGFRKTHVPLKLGKYPGEQLVSRSQAKRILARFDLFSEVMLDFYGIDEIGQAFADELFRVFPSDHPNVKISCIRMSEEVQKIVAYVVGDTQRELLASGGFFIG